MIWTEAGIESWARIALDEGVEARESGIRGASNGGRLKAAKMVRLSRRQKRARDFLGTLRVDGGVRGQVAVDELAAGVDWRGDGSLGPNIRANRESLYTHSDILTAVVVRNFARPADTLLNGRLFNVEVIVSAVLAAM